MIIADAVQDDGAFSAGGDLDLVLEIANDPATRRRVFHEARDLVYNLIDCPKSQAQISLI